MNHAVKEVLRLSALEDILDMALAGYQSANLLRRHKSYIYPKMLWKPPSQAQKIRHASSSKILKNLATSDKSYMLPRILGSRH